MPNWCRGDLKIRGTNENIERFLTEGIMPIPPLLSHERPKLEIKKDACSCTVKTESPFGFFILGTYRQFFEQKEIEFEYQDQEPSVFVLELAGAWAIDAEGLSKVSEKFGLDFKVYGFERGMEFNQDVEIIAGQIVKNNEIKFDDYAWECICPDLGG